MSMTPMFRGTIRHCQLLVPIGSLGLLACLVFAGFLQGAAIKDEPFANMDFVRIEPGEFRMGCSIGDDKCGDSEKPPHMVRITRAFELQAKPVTEEQWKKVMGRDASSLVMGKKFTAKVSWDDAQRFLKKLNAKKDGYQYRLPTEAEWEYSARNETKDPNSATPEDFAVYGENTGSRGGGSRLDVIIIKSGNRMACGDNGKLPPCPGGELGKPNARGLFRMLGNSQEWVQDTYGPYSGDLQTDPQGPPVGSRKVVRGFNWGAPFAGMVFPASRVSARIGWESDTTELFSFRCVMEPKEGVR